jgi:hypothetical protein
MVCVLVQSGMLSFDSTVNTQSFDFELPDEGYSRNVHVH